MKATTFQDLIEDSLKNGNFYLLSGLTLGALCQLSDNRAIRNLGIASMVAGTGIWAAKKLEISSVQPKGKYKPIFKGDYNADWSLIFDRELLKNFWIPYIDENQDCGWAARTSMSNFGCFPDLYNKDNFMFLYYDEKRTVYKEHTNGVASNAEIDNIWNYAYSAIEQGYILRGFVNNNATDCKRADIHSDHVLLIVGLGVMDGQKFFQVMENQPTLKEKGNSNDATSDYKRYIINSSNMFVADPYFNAEPPKAPTPYSLNLRFYLIAIERILNSKGEKFKP